MHDYFLCSFEQKGRGAKRKPQRAARARHWQFINHIFKCNKACNFSLSLSLLHSHPPFFPALWPLDRRAASKFPLNLYPSAKSYVPNLLEKSAGRELLLDDSCDTCTAHTTRSLSRGHFLFIRSENPDAALRGLNTARESVFWAPTICICVSGKCLAGWIKPL
jgi:hypothetical protein